MPAGIRGHAARGRVGDCHVTPYNLGIRYRSYEDTLPRDRYLEWSGEWIAAAGRVLDPAGSLFLNVGAKPADPWTALDVAQPPARICSFRTRFTG